MTDTKNVRALQSIRSSQGGLVRGKTYELPSREADFLCSQKRAEKVAIKKAKAKSKAKSKGTMTTGNTGSVVA